MASIEEWVIDASASDESIAPLLAFCPIDEDASGASVVTGLTLISDHPGPGRSVIGVWHPDGPGAAEVWCEARGGWDEVSRSFNDHEEG